MAHNRQHNEGRSSTDVFGNSVVLSGEALAESNAQAEIGLYGSVGGYGKKRIGEQSMSCHIVPILLRLILKVIIEWGWHLKVLLCVY